MLFGTSKFICKRIGSFLVFKFPGLIGGMEKSGKIKSGGEITGSAPGDEPITIPCQVSLQELFQFDKDVARRLVSRGINPKEAFTLRDLSGCYFRASLKDLHAGGGAALAYERMQQTPEPTIEITLACAVLARQRMIFVMQKATELGVTRIAPLLTDYSVPAEGLEHEKASSWPNQLVRATKQCRRGSLPQLLPPLSLDTFLNSKAVTDSDLCIVLDDHSKQSATDETSPRRVVLLVGPEGGFSDRERTLLLTRAQALSFGGRILRAETAVIVGLTALQIYWGDYRSEA